MEVEQEQASPISDWTKEEVTNEVSSFQPPVATSPPMEPQPTAAWKTLQPDTMDTTEEMETVLGETITPTESEADATRPSTGGGPSGGPPRDRMLSTSDSHQHFVGNLPHDCTDEHLVELFTKYGKVSLLNYLQTILCLLGIIFRSWM